MYSCVSYTRSLVLRASTDYFLKHRHHLGFAEETDRVLNAVEVSLLERFSSVPDGITRPGPRRETELLKNTRDLSNERFEIVRGYTCR
jgi:hypothetical protein